MFDIDKFVAAIWWHRKTRALLSAKDWEQVCALAMGGEVKGGDIWMADVVSPISDIKNNTTTVKTIKRLFPDKESVNEWIIYCRDPENKLLALLDQKAKASLQEFNSSSMTECIIMHDVDPEDSNYYHVIAWIRPQEDYNSFNIEWQRETKNTDFYSLCGSTKEIFKRQKSKASAYQTCLSQSFELIKTDAVFDQRIYSPTSIPSIEEMTKQYEFANNQQQCQ